MGAVLGRFRRAAPPAKVLLAGLDSAGKTTILHRLKLGPDKSDVAVTTLPTLSFNAEEVQYKAMHFTLWDVGGQDSLRFFWRHHFTGTQAVVYVVDSNDAERIPQSGDELRAMMADRELEFACLLVLANKSDLPHAVSLPQLTHMMHLDEFSRLQWHAIRTCARTGEGLAEAMEWLSANVKPL